MRNQPESVLKMFLKLVSEMVQIYITRGLINIQCCFVIDFIVCNGPENHSTLI